MKLNAYFDRYFRQAGVTDEKLIRQHGDILGKKELTKINRNDMVALQKSLSDYAPTTQARICGSLRTVYRWACNEADIIPKDLPIRGGKAGEKDPLTKKEAKALLLSLDPDPHDLAQFMLETGARYCEARIVTLDDLDAKQLTVKLTHRKGTGLPAHRYVPLSETFFKHLVVLASDGRRRLLMDGQGTWLGSGNKFRTALAEAAERAGIQRKVTPHLLRHTFGTLLGEKGTAIQVIASLMGHSKLETCRQYVKVRNADRRDEVLGLYD